MKIKRIYASLQSFNHVGNYHTDDWDDNTFTFCMYTMVTPNDYENKDGYNIYDYSKSKVFFSENYGGNFYIKTNESHIYKVFKYKENGAIFFNSKLIHNGDCFNDNINAMRVVISYKLYV